jgi:hypothetical protein
MEAIGDILDRIKRAEFSAYSERNVLKMVYNEDTNHLTLLCGTRECVCVEYIPTVAEHFLILTCATNFHIIDMMTKKHKTYAHISVDAALDDMITYLQTHKKRAA